jgi:hypothetical protein
VTVAPDVTATPSTVRTTDETFTPERLSRYVAVMVGRNVRTRCPSIGSGSMTGADWSRVEKNELKPEDWTLPAGSRWPVTETA